MLTISGRNGNALVFETLDIARQEHLEVKPLFHSDRGYQYTSKSFRKKLEEAGMTQSISRVSRCIDNGPMEAFWGMLKSEMYYLKKFHTYDELKEACDWQLKFLFFPLSTGLSQRLCKPPN